MGRNPEWTNRSVLALAQGEDPVAKVISLARKVVADALDKGWSGPPFDPVALAEVLRIPIVGTDDVRDARTTGIGEAGRVRIEFNPSRPPARVRFSIAHEIGHTLFPDCAKHVRNRSAYHELTPDGWQLEALCNIAAAELLMPAGSLPLIDVAEINAERILDWRRAYDVSVEALLIRIIHLSDVPCAMFCTSARGADLTAAPARYRVDYSIGSRSWDGPPLTGFVLPTDSLVQECASVGFTAHGDEIWGRAGSVHVECIAIPPYLGSVQPRVVGLLRRKVPDERQRGPALLRFVRGDATKPRGSDLRIVTHIVNDATPNWGGAGFASALRRTHPESQDAFRHWVREGNLHLGAMHVGELAPTLRVATLVAQHGYGPSSRPRIRYSALRSCLEAVGEYAKAHGGSVHMPRLGAGQAGGDWGIIEGLIREYVTARGVSTTVYDLPGAPPPMVAPQATLNL